ncbi:hypothetical protein C0J45_17471 [Silurus meridionalis]|nr:hypothetical protein C0J45_17471 [Silurus meridionalis]
MIQRPWSTEDDQYFAAPQDPYLRLGCASRRLPGTSAGVTYLTPITLPAPKLTISTHEEADADSAAHGSHGSGHVQSQTQLASRRGAV